MEYSLNNLNLNSNLNELTITTLINSLNLIGLEIDGISKKKLKTNQFLNNIKILIKIPSNRQDLLIENFFLREISSIFLFEIYNIWKKLRLNYRFLLKQKYIEYLNYSTIDIDSELSSIFTYGVELNQFRNLSSPLWIQNKLSNLGIETFNNFNDIVNLVVSEWGQIFNIVLPSLYGHDNKKCKYTLVRLNYSENFSDLNGVELKLLPGTIVLKDESNHILLVLGIFNSFKLNLKETKLFLEATFYNIEENKLLINLTNSKISLKYLRKIFLENFKFSFQRLLTLIEILNYSSLIPIKYCTKRQNILLNFNKILILKKKSLQNYLNIDFIDEKIFQKAGLKIVCKTEKEFFFKISNSRKDLIREIDLIEEYSRFFGYKHFKEIFPSKTIFYSKKKNESIFFLKQFFLSLGFNEIVTTSMQDFEKNQNSFIKITNPLNKELSILRTTLLSKLLEIFINNLRLSSNTKNFFEIGRVFQKCQNKIYEENKLAAIFQYPFSISSKDTSLEWFYVIGLLENLLLNFGYKNVIKEKINTKLNFFHPTKSILFKDGNKILGFFGQINPIYHNFPLLKIQTYLLELNLTYFNSHKLYSSSIIYTEYSKYPKIIKDISFLINKEINFHNLKILLENNFLYIKTISFFDIYFEKNNKDMINIGIRLEFQSINNTLKNELIETEIQKIRLLLISRYKVIFRN